MIIKLTETDRKIERHCRELETALTGQLNPEPLQLAVEVLADFTALGPMPEKKRSSPAAYDEKQGKILINWSTFQAYDHKTQKGIIAHELGHAALHAVGHKDARSDVEADLCVARWGLLDHISEDRKGSYGTEWVEALEGASADEDDARAKLEAIRMRRRAGI